MQQQIKIAISSFLLGVCAPALMLAQGPPPPLGNLVQRIALYPDAMLANILTAATYPDQVPEADQWADQHAGLHGDALAHAIGEDHLPWDPSVQALLPFPQVLEMMARDPGWTQKLGDAALSQRGDVMDAVQRMRHSAERYGYLQTNSYYSVVNAGGFIEINPLNPGVFVVPIYDPGIVFVAPRPGFAVRAAISWASNQPGRRICAVGLGTGSVRSIQLGWARVVREQSRMGADLGEPEGVRASMVGTSL